MVSINIDKGCISKQLFALGALDSTVRLGDVKSKIKKWKIIKYRQNPMKTLLFAISV